MKKSLLLAAVVALGMAAPAHADFVTYNGGVFDISQVGGCTAAGAGYSCVIRYAVNFTNFTGDDDSPDTSTSPTNRQDFLVSIDFMLSGVTALTNPVPFLSNYSGGIGTWTASLGEQSTAAGVGASCANGASMSLCADTAGAGAGTGGSPSWTYFWDFTVVYSTNLTAAAFQGARIRAAFEDGTGQQAGLLSMRTSTVPEPGTLLFLGLGLFGAAAVVRRRR